MAGQTFTTYINAKRTSSIDAEFAAVENRADKTFNSIKQKAEAASKAVAGLTGGRGTAGLKTSPVTTAYLNGFDKAKDKTDKLTAAQERLERENSRLVRSLRTSAQTLQVVQGPLGPIAGRVSAAADAIARLSGVTLGLAGAGAALFAYVSAANKFVDIRSRLAPLYESQTQVNSALNEVAGIANRARVGLEPVVDLYARLKLAADQFGISQSRIGRITELATKAARLSGGTAQSQEAGIYQFAQGFGSGSLGGDELKSVRENTLFLAKALSTGLAKLPEFKGIDVSIGKLKTLGMEGKLTADVIARAMEASAAETEAAFAKLPPTLQSSFAALGTNATLFVGRFEQATGTVSGLATAVAVLANNITPIAAIVGGIASAWLAVAAARKAGDVSSKIGDRVAAVRAEVTAAKEGLVVATGQRDAIVQRIAALRQEQAAINTSTVALERELAVQTAIAEQASIASRSGLPGMKTIGAEANAKAITSTRILADERQRLGTIASTLAANERKLEGANAGVASATANAASKSGILKIGMSTLLGAINPVGIAVGLATSAFLAWALSESEAEKNAKKVEDAQRSLASVIDQTTGKILEQNAAILAGQKQTALQGARAAFAGYQDARTAVARAGDSLRTSRFLGTAQQRQAGGYSQPLASATERQALSLLEQYGSGKIRDVGVLNKGLGELAKRDKSLQGLVDQVNLLGGAAVQAAQKVENLKAIAAQADGANDPETLRRSRNDFSGGQSRGEDNRNLIAESEALRTKLRDQRFAAETQKNESLANLEKKRGQMAADDYVRERAQILATYDSAIAGLDRKDAAAEAKHQRELARIAREEERRLAAIKREDEARAARTEKRSDILGQFSDDPKAVVRARDKIDDLQKLVGQTMDRIQAATSSNPLGQGLYTQAMADADAANIERGVQKPYRDLIESQERSLNIQRLQLEGGDLEAEALSQAYQLYDQIGSVTRDQYDNILHNLEAERTINDALAQRERLIAPLRESVSALRNETQTAIETILNGGNPFKSIGDFAKSALRDFNKITAAQLTAKLTGGLDERVRDLISGKTKVDGAIAQYVGALQDTGAKTNRLADAMETTATAATHAADALNSISAPSPTSGGSVAAVAAAAATKIASGNTPLPSSFYKQGVSVGSGIGDNVIYKALGPLGAVITENLRSQGTQNSLFARGLTTARVSDHTTSQDAYDVRLPQGMSFAEATRLIKTAASELGAKVVTALDETVSGGTGRHGHYVIRPDGTAASTAQAAAGASPASIGGVPAGVVSAAIKSVTEVAINNKSTPVANTGAAQIGPDGEIVVTGPSRRASGGSNSLQSIEKLYNGLGKDIGTSLDKTLGTKFLGQIGSKLGTALQGAQYGQMASGLAKAIGIKQSSTGAAIGGAAGAVLGSIIPGVGTAIGGIVGGLLGGTIGGLFKKTKKASAVVSSGDGEFSASQATGTSSMLQSVNAAASGVVSGLTSIADQLGGGVGSFGNIRIGQYKDKWRVNVLGGDLGGRAGIPGLKDNLADEAEAVAYAVQYAIGQGAITGISQASQNLLKNGSKDLQTQLNKALAIESIPKRLMQLKDPIRYAVTELNKEFVKLIAYLKEGGATAEQYKEAQELYDLERVKAIEQQSAAVSTAIQDMLDKMLGSTESPLNRRTVYDNAQEQLNRYAGDVMAGKPVDTDALLKAVQNFQEASRALNGSDSAFFSDFNYLVGLLEKAKANNTSVTSTGTYDASTLPASPFSDAAVQALINGTSATTVAIQVQTGVLVDRLDAIYGALNLGNYAGTAIDFLPSSNTLTSKTLGGM